MLQDQLQPCRPRSLWADDKYDPVYSHKLLDYRVKGPFNQSGPLVGRLKMVDGAL